MAALHLVLMCCLKFNALSRCAPRYFVMLLLAVVSPLTSIVFATNFPNLLGQPK